MKPLLLLHGAIGAKDQLEPLAKALAENYKIYLFNFSGHGGKKIDNEFSIPDFADEVLQWIRDNQPGRISVFGYSMGGYVAMYLAAHYPAVIDKVVTLATKYHWTKEIAAKEVMMLDPDVIETKVPAFAAQLQVRHQPVPWKLVLEKTASMLLALGRSSPLTTEDYRQIKNEVLLLIGDRDKMVTLEETQTVYQHLPAGQLVVLPATRIPLKR